MIKSDAKIELKNELKSLQAKGEAPDHLKWFSWAMIKEDYLYNCKTPKERYGQIAHAAAALLPSDNKMWEQKFFDLQWSGFMIPSTPVLGNLGTNRGLAVSCSGSVVNDSMHDIAFTDYEIKMLSKAGFGTSAYLNTRAGNSPISTGGFTNPTSDWVEMYWRTQNTTNQGSLRRGSTAIYLNFNHPDLPRILAMLNTHDKLHLGVIVTAADKAALRNGEEWATELYFDILTWRMKKGKPYLIFIDNVQAQDPIMYAEHNLQTIQSQLCTEIFNHSDSLHTMVCTLSSINGAKYDEYKNEKSVFDATVFLDCVTEDLIQRGSKMPGLERVVRSAIKGRPLGLGLLGFHTYLQDKMLPFDGLQARFHNQMMFKHLHDESLEASQFMADWLGEPEWCKGYGVRNTHRTAVAPNTSSAFFGGGYSQGIEPLVANVYTQKLAKVGAVDRMPAKLVEVLKSKGQYNSEVINSIVENTGSVQHFEFLSQDEKDVFKTAYEINQKVLIDLAEQRQPYICQGQSLNLFMSAAESEEWIHEVHKHAFDQKLLKSLYYVRTQAGITADTDANCKGCAN